MTIGRTNSVRRIVSARGPLPGIGDLINLFFVWAARRRQRMQLASLPDRMLFDIGVSPSDADHESRKPFWRS